MKKLMIITTLLLSLGFMSRQAKAEVNATATLTKVSMDYDYAGNLALNTGLAYDEDYILDVDSYKASKASLVVTYTSSTYSALSFSTNAITMASGNITAAAHGLPVGLPVLLSTAAGTVPGPLSAETTYYIIPVSANIIQLATTSAQAIALDPIILVSSTTSGTQTYNLTPLAIAGTPAFTFKASNDNVAYVDLAVSSSTAGLYTAEGVSFGRDFGVFNYRWLKMAVTAPTAGAINIKAVVHTKP